MEVIATEEGERAGTKKQKTYLAMQIWGKRLVEGPKGCCAMMAGRPGCA
jgi:hypothetical protein